LKVAITEMYRRIPWELFADRWGPAIYTLKTTDLVSIRIDAGRASQKNTYLH